MTPATIVERSEGLITVTFNRPESKNSLNASSWNDLEKVLTELETDPRARALVLTGAAGNFSSGADLSGGMSDGERDAEQTSGGLTAGRPEELGMSSRSRYLPGRVT